MAKFCYVMSAERHNNLTGKTVMRYLLGCGKVVVRPVPKKGKPHPIKISCDCRK